MRYEIELLDEHYGLLAASEALRMAVSGSNDYLGPVEVKVLRAFLLERLAGWTPSRKGDERYDEAVKELCAAALAETEGSWMLEEQRSREGQ